MADRSETSQEQQREERQEQKQQEESSFLKLLSTNRDFRLYLTSYLLTHGGEWLTYVASISVIEAILGGETSRTSISVLVMVRLLPNVFLSSIGGALADSRDRRESMITLNLLHCAIPFFYILAGYVRSIPLIYLVTLVQECVAALYEPCKSAIVTQLVHNDDELQKAIALSGMSWSCMAAVGASVGGFVTASFGANVCFLMDSALFLCSASLLHTMRGKFNAAEKELASYEGVWHRIRGMTVEGIRYLSGEFWWPLVLMKASVALIYGASDVLNVSFSELGGGDSDMKLGLLFAFVGVGCMTGLFVSDAFTSVSRLKSLQWAGIVSIAFSAVGCLGMGTVDVFAWLCFFNVIRSGGSSGVWINSSVLLQMFSAPEKMGRVVAIDNALGLLAESWGALMCGFLQDHMHLSAADVSLVMSAIGWVVFLLWCCYHCLGYGAASPQAASLVQTTEGKGDTEAQQDESRISHSEQTPLLSPA